MLRYAYDYDLSSLDDLEGDKFDEHACAEIGQSFNRGLFESEGCRNFTASGLPSWTGVQAVGRWPMNLECEHWLTCGKLSPDGTPPIARK